MAVRPRWDIFCTVVDNYGDIGVCWRLARQLAAERGYVVRLWVDDLASFARIRPEVVAGTQSQAVGGVEVRWWREPFPETEPADVVVEAFACSPPGSYVAAMAARARKPVWINLEYLSAESWIEGCHRLPSPHPRLPLVKHFFFPGFSEASGGLLLERGLLEARRRFDASADERARFWQSLELAPPAPSALQVSLFCYPQSGTTGLLRAWAEGDTPVRCLVPQGTAVGALAEFFGTGALAAGTRLQREALEIAVFPFLDQDRYDRLLWACDVNLVRGEDSFVRAQWAARPLLWQIYPQKEDAHWPKLEAFLERYCAGLPAEAAADARVFWEAWNRGEPRAVAAAWPRYRGHLPQLRTQARKWAETLAKQGNLANRLAEFCENLLK